MRISGDLVWTGEIASAHSRPPCGGGSGWGVAPRYPIRAYGVDSRKGMAQPPSLALPHKGGGNWRLASSRTLQQEVV